jgi:hypothetical protein
VTAADKAAVDHSPRYHGDGAGSPRSPRVLRSEAPCASSPPKVLAAATKGGSRKRARVGALASIADAYCPPEE